ncbi:MAG: hypothetical protein GY855_13995 [candidate division Zixibacteria bacterium]|nr:hypothetical protein [candidate division Zixibacteria bacterium]
MRFSEIKKLIDAYVKQNNNVFADLSLDYCDKPCPYEMVFPPQDKCLEKKGLFFFTSPDDEILLIGKSKTTIADALAKQQEEMNKMASQTGDPKEYNVHTIRVRPAYYQSMILSVLLTMVFGAEGKLPPLNKTI